MSSAQNEYDFSEYEAFPLVHSMLRNDASRTASLKEQGKNQMNCPQSGDGWAPSLFIIKGRALDWMIFPWLFIVGHATLYTVVQEIFFDNYSRDTENWDFFFR
jgi:hypothetical protein